MESSAGSPTPTTTTTTTTNTTTIGKRLLRIVRTVYYLLRKGIPKSKLLMDLHLLLKRGKLAGKALTTLLTLFHHHHHHHHHQTTSDEVQLSCTNTPNNSHPFINYFHAATTKKRTSRRRPQDDGLDAAAIATAFEIMNAGFSEAGSPSSAFPTPSPMLMGPMMVRKLRITDSPFPIVEESGDGGKIDRAADEFIRNFYEQLRCQQLASAAATPDQYFDDHRRTRT